LIQHDIKWKTNAQAWRDDQRTHLSFSLKEAKQPSVLLEVTDPYGRQLGTLKRKNAFLNTWFIHDNSDHPIATFTLSNPFMAILGRKGTFSSNNMPFGDFQISRLSQKFDIHIDWNACPNMDRRMVIGAVILAMNFERKF